MKKIIIVILCLMLVFALLSVAPEDNNFMDIIGDDGDETSSTTTGNVTTAAPVFVTDSVFYYYSGDELRSTTNISSVSNNTRGYFVKDNVAYFCIKTNGSEEKNTHLNIPYLTYNSDVYNYCCYYTSDMKVLTEHSNEEIRITNPALVIYATMQNWSDLKAAHFDLLNNQPVTLGFYDPVSPEIPGA